MNYEDFLDQKTMEIAVEDTRAPDQADLFDLGLGDTDEEAS
jgi:hypothetical protein